MLSIEKSPKTFVISKESEWTESEIDKLQGYDFGIQYKNIVMLIIPFQGYLRHMQYH